MPRSFEDLIADGAAAPVEGWDFSWFEGRATEERPSWGYAGLVSDRIGQATAVLDIETGGGEVVAEAVRSARAATGAVRPAVLAATESWPPNRALAARALAPHGGAVVGAADEADLPFARATFDLVTSRHPVVVLWPEIARVLAPGGSYLAQHVGPGSNRELTDFMMGPQPVGRTRSPRTAVAAARRAGLDVVDVREQALRVEFFDVGAVVHFLRKVPWTVPGFTVADYLGPLARMHAHIRANGSFVSHSQRFLIEARKPSSRPGPNPRLRLLRIGGPGTRRP